MRLFLLTFIFAVGNAQESWVQDVMGEIGNIGELGNSVGLPQGFDAFQFEEICAVKSQKNRKKYK